MDVLTALKERRSINFFDPERKISRELINELLSVANLAPSSMNLQPWEVIVVIDPERKKALRKCAFDQPKAEEASAMFIIIANPGAIEKNIDTILARGAELGYFPAENIEKQKASAYKSHGPLDSEKRKFFAMKNTAFFAMSIMAAARGLGLETHPMDGFSHDMLRQEFNIDPGKLLPCLIAVGYPRPGLKLLPRAYRRPLDDFVRYE